MAKKESVKEYYISKGEPWPTLTIEEKWNANVILSAVIHRTFMSTLEENFGKEKALEIAREVYKKIFTADLKNMEEKLGLKGKKDAQLGKYFIWVEEEVIGSHGPPPLEDSPDKLVRQINECIWSNVFTPDDCMKIIGGGAGDMLKEISEDLELDMERCIPQDGIGPCRWVCYKKK